MLIVGRRNYRRAAARGSRRPYQGDAIGRRSAGYRPCAVVFSVCVPWSWLQWLR